MKRKKETTWIWTWWKVLIIMLAMLAGGCASDYYWSHVRHPVFLIAIPLGVAVAFVTALVLFFLAVGRGTRR